MRRFLWATVALLLLVSRASAADNYLADPFERKAGTKPGLSDDGDKTSQLRGASTAATRTNPEKANAPYGDTATSAPRSVDSTTGAEHRAVTAVILPWEALGDLRYSSTKSPSPKPEEQGNGASVTVGENEKAAGKKDELQQHESGLSGGRNSDKGAALQNPLDDIVGLPARTQKTTSAYSPETKAPSNNKPYSREPQTGSPSTSMLHDEKALPPYHEATNVPTRETGSAVSYFPTGGEKHGGEVLAVGLPREKKDDSSPALPARDNWAVWQTFSHEVGLPKASASPPAYSEKTSTPDGHATSSPNDGDEKRSKDRVASLLLRQEPATTSVGNEKAGNEGVNALSKEQASSTYSKETRSPSDDKATASYDATSSPNNKQHSLSGESSRTAPRSVIGDGVHDVDVAWAESPSRSSAAVSRYKTDEIGDGGEHGVGRTDGDSANAEKRSTTEESDSVLDGNLLDPKATATDDKTRRFGHAQKSNSPYSPDASSLHGENTQTRSDEAAGSAHKGKTDSSYGSRASSPSYSIVDGRSQAFETRGYSNTETPGVDRHDKAEENDPVYDAAMGPVVPWNNGRPQLGDYDATEKTKVKPHRTEATAYVERSDTTSTKSRGNGKLLDNTVPWNEHHSLFSRDLQSEGRTADDQPSEQPSEQPSVPATEQPSPSDQPNVQPSETSSKQATEQSAGGQPEQPSESPSEQSGQQPSGQPAIEDSEVQTTVVDVRWDQDDCHPCDVPTEPPTLAPVYPYNNDDFESHLPNVTEDYKPWEEVKENESSDPSTRSPTKRPKKPHKPEFVHCMKVIGEYGQYYECENNSTETPIPETEAPTEIPRTEKPNEDATPEPYEPTPHPTEPDKPTPGPSEPTPTPTDPTNPNDESTPAPTKPGESTPAPPKLNDESTPAPKPSESTPAPTKSTPAPTEPGESTPAPTKLTPAPTEPGESTPAPTKLTPAPTEPGESTPAPTKSYDEPTPTPAASTTDGETSTTYPTETKTSKTTKPATMTGTNSSTGATTDKTTTAPPTSVSAGDTYANPGTTDSTTTGTDTGSGNTIVTGISTGGASSGDAALGGGAIAGIVIACIVFVIIVVGAVLVRQRSIARQREENLFAELTATGGRALETDYAAM
uniref:Uncharacterized protein n=1 Tax=Phytophthora ramorum TaxID=164328 RepID=H3H3N7_PHYRM